MRLIHSNITIYIYLFLLTYSADIRKLYSQETTSQEIRSETEALYSDRINERVYLHTDRLFYLTGEKIWFRIYLLEESTLEPVGFSRVAYAELLNNRNEVVSHQKVKIDKSGGYGYMVIPGTIQSGYYFIRAYTHWMKNYNPADYFIAALAIVNPDTPLYGTIDSSFYTGNDIHIDFFPEGGKLINDVECLTALQATDKEGKPAKVKGVISSDGDNSIAEFRTGSGGLGSFRFTPREGNTYSAHIIIPDRNEEIYYLPESENTGMILQVVSRSDFDLMLRIAGIDHKTAMPALYTIMVVNRKGVTFFNNLRISTTPYYLQIPAGNLTDGINKLILINGDGVIESERYVFFNPYNHLGIRINTNILKYKRREKVELEIITTDVHGNPFSSDLSISVFYTGDKEFYSPGIQDYLFLYSYIYPKLAVQGLTYPGTYEDLDNLTDQLMLTGFCSELSDGEFLSGTEQKYLYFAEMEGITLSGRIIDPATQNPVSNVPVFLSIVGENAFLKSFMTHEDGRFYFCLDDECGEKNIVLSHGNPSSDFLIIVDEPYSEVFAEIPDLQLKLDESWRSFIERQMINLQLNTIYDSIDEPFYKAGKQKTGPFYIKPDFTIRMEDFVRLPNMEEIFRELVKPVLVTRENGQMKLNVLDYNINRIIGPNPVFIVDGVPFFDSRLILEMNPEDIAQIDIVSYKYYKGILEMDGIIDIRTNLENLPFPEMPGNTFRQVYQTYQPDQEYKIPDYPDEQKLKSRIPDFRNLLYWNPSVKTDHEGKALISFYTSDNTGKYSIRIEGISDNGLFGSATYSLKVIK